MALVKVDGLVRGFRWFVEKLKGLIISKTPFSSKLEINWTMLKYFGLALVFLFITIVLLIPNSEVREFYVRESQVPAEDVKNPGIQASPGGPQNMSNHIWGQPLVGGAPSSGSQVNYNTQMILGSKTNAHTQLTAGVRMTLRIRDKFVVSQDSVPVLAELILNSTTESGLMLPAGTRFYGEASFQKGSERAMIHFRQISLPNGQMRAVSATAIGKDGQSGIAGNTYSDGTKNAVGSVVTSFVSGFAAGSMETDLYGRAKGGVENGLRGAIAATAKERASAYGEKLKTQREWIEVPANSECDAILTESINLQDGGEHE